MRRFAFICLALLALTAVIRADDAWDKQVAEYKASQKRPSLWKRTQGREALALTRDVRAIPILAADYKSAEKPRDQVQFLCAALATRYCNSKDCVDALETWRGAHSRAEDAWLWYRTLRIYANWRGVDDVKAIIRNAELDVFLRAAALEAIAARQDAGLLELVNELLLNLPLDKRRWVLAESCMAVLTRQPVTDKAFKPPAEQLARVLDMDTAPEHTKLVIARAFRRIFNAEHAYLAAAPWLKKLEGDNGRVPSRTLAQPTFLGLQAEGNRICYVIDLSDSMLTPLTENEKRDLRNPVTGHRKQDGGDEPEPQPDPDVAALPWDSITTRFDAAREFLKLSLRKLTTEQHFAVVAFGTQAALLDACPGMQQVNEKRIAKAIEELDAIKPGLSNGKPTLRGMTNLHGGLQRAFQCKSKGLIKDYEYVDWLGFEQGADTIFVLSDGKQSWSDWDCIDKADDSDVSGNPESGGDLGEKGEHPELHFYGPYVDQRHMLEDLERMNLFRKAEIHAIGIGEAEEVTLRAIAQIGHGQLRLVGKK